MATSVKDWEIETLKSLEQVNALFQALKNNSIEALQHKPTSTSWSAEECMQHLNSYGRYYVPQLSLSIEKATTKSDRPGASIKGSWIGRKFTQMMSVKENGMANGKMKAPKDHRPKPGSDVSKTLIEFEAQFAELKKCIEACQRIDIDKAKVPISISRWIKMRVGDVIHFYLAHHIRHLHQASRAINSYTHQ